MTARYLLRQHSLNVLLSCRVSTHLHIPELARTVCLSCGPAQGGQTWCARPLSIQPLVQLTRPSACGTAACAATSWGCPLSSRHHSRYVAARALAATEQQAAEPSAEAATSVAALAGRAQQAQAVVADIVQACPLVSILARQLLRTCLHGAAAPLSMHQLDVKVPPVCGLLDARIACKQAANVAELRRRLAELEGAASAADLWESQERAQATLQQMADVKGTLEEVEGFQALLADVSTAAELAQLEVRGNLAMLPLAMLLRATAAFRTLPEP